MAVTIDHNRWQVFGDDFAVRVQIPDVEGFFKAFVLPKARTLIIEPGTRVLLVEDGVLIGEVSPGSYTLETFIDRLQFWKKRQVTAVLTRSEDVLVRSTHRHVPTQESLCVEIDFRWAVHIHDVVSFLSHLMGDRDKLGLRQLVPLLGPVVRQAVFSVAGGNSIEVLTGPGAAPLLEAGIRQHVDERLARYGLALGGVRGLSIRAPELDELRKKTGKAWLDARETQLFEAASQIETDKEKIDLEKRRRKVALRRGFWDADHAEAFNKIESERDYLKLVEPVRKEGLLLREEWENLEAAYEQHKDDRTRLREHVLSVLGVARERELGELRQEMNRALKIKELEAQVEFTCLSNQRAALEWRHKLECQLEEAENELRIGKLKAELDLHKAEQDLQTTKQKQEWEVELDKRKSSIQLERWERVQETNARLAEAAHRREKERLQAISGLGTEALIATAGEKNAGHLADLKKHEASQQVALAQQQLVEVNRLNAERAGMYEKMNESEKAKAQAIAEAYKEAMKSQEGLVDKMIGGLTQVSAAANSPQVPPTPPPGPAT